jgi:hypothetical protein
VTLANDRSAHLVDRPIAQGPADRSDRERRREGYLRGQHRCGLPRTVVLHDAVDQAMRAASTPEMPRPVYMRSIAAWAPIAFGGVTLSPKP